MRERGAQPKPLEIEEQAWHLDAGCASGEMADTPDLGSGPARGGGSSPLSRTMFYWGFSRFLRLLRIFSESGSVDSEDDKGKEYRQSPIKTEIFSLQNRVF